MELSPLLVVGIVLLLVVAGLALWQRMQQVDKTASGRRAAGTAPPAAPASTASDSPAAPAATELRFEFATDPVLGEMSWDAGIWSADEDYQFADTTVMLEAHGPRAGLTASQRDLLQAALDQHLDLDTRARAAIRQELDRRGVGESRMEPYSVEVKAGPDGRETGYLWYEVEECEGGDVAVTSTDGWQTLKIGIESEIEPKSES